MTIESLDWHEQLAAVVEFSSDAILLIDADARVRSWSPGAERLFGYTLEDVEGRPVSMLLPPGRIASQTYRLLRLLARGRRAKNYETVGRRKDGRPVDVAISISPLLSQTGAQGACLIARDIGRRRRVDMRRHQQVRRARLRADVAGAFARAELNLGAALQACADAMVRHLAVAGARIWFVAERSGQLELAASAGVSSPQPADGAAIVAPGSRIAQVAISREPFVSNALRTDLGADLDGFVDVRETTALAAYPVVVREQVAGVVALFDRRALRPETLDLVPWIADAIAHGIERVRTSEALGESDARFLAVAESGVAALAIHRGKILYANAAMERLTGFTRDELVRMHIADVLGAENREEMRARFETPLKAAGADRFEAPVSTRSGETRWVDVGARLVSYHGDPAVVVLALDVTDRKRMENALSDHEALVHALAASDLVGVIVYEGNRLVEVSGASALTGYSREELLAMPDFFQIIHPAFREAARARAQARARGESVPSGWEMKIVRKGGDELWVHTCADRSRLGPGGAMVAVVIDITERKQAAEQLAANERFLRTVVESEPECVKTIGRDGTVLQMNRAGVHMIRAPSLDAVIGQRLLDLIVPEHRAAWQSALERVFSGENVVHEFDVINFAQERQTFESHAVPLRDGEGTIGAMLAITRDITARKLAEQELQAREETERKARWAAEVLHDANLRLTRTLDLNDTLSALLDRLAYVAPYDSANIIAVEDELHSLAVRGFENWIDPNRVRDLTPQLGTNRLIQHIVAAGRGLIVGDTGSSPDWQAFPETSYIRCWMGVPLFAGPHLVGLISLDKAEAGFFTQQHLRMTEALAGPAAVAIQNARLFRQVASAHQRLEQVSKRLVEVQEAERREIARELHDEIGQSLTGLKLTLEAMPRVSADAREAKLRGAQELVMELMTRVRELSLSLRPPVLDDMGLLAGLVALFDRYRAQTHIDVVFNHHGLEGRLPMEIETAAFRIVQAALTNVARHANADKVMVRIRVMPDTLLGLIADDGCGFDAPAAMQQATGGLSGMKERAALLGGWLWVESSPGKGTRIMMALPLKSAPDP